MLFRCKACRNWYGFRVGELDRKIGEVKYGAGTRGSTYVREDLTRVRMFGDGSVFARGR